MADDSPDLRRVILLDSLATRYHLLPSEVIQRADTLDVMVMDTAMAWQRVQRERMEAEHRGEPKPAPKIPVNKLQEMIDKVKRDGPKTNKKRHNSQY